MGGLAALEAGLLDLQPLQYILCWLIFTKQERDTRTFLLFFLTQKGAFLGNECNYRLFV